MIKKIINTGIIALSTLSAWSVAMAQTSNRPPLIPVGAEATEPLLIPKSAGNVPEEQFFGGAFLPEVTKLVIEMAGVVAVLFMIIGGIQILTAYGSDEKIGKAKKTITFAIIGLLIAILSYAIVSIISAINLNPQTNATPTK